MSKTIVITSRHELGIEGAKQRITDRFDTLKAGYVGSLTHADLRWEDNVGYVAAKAVGQTVKARIPVEADKLTIEIDLPMLLAPFAGAIEAVLRGNADALRPSPKPTA